MRCAPRRWSRQRSRRSRRGCPRAINYAYANDTTDFIKLSIWEVVKTLLEAILLVVLVMFVFLQSWRATLIPFIAVPVVLLGTFAILYALGFSINTMTLFGLVLAIGLLVDDAIVVVENVERLMHENPEMTPRDATIASMEQIQMALVAIALVLSAVFLPMVFFGGSTGVIYRQFSATIVSAMALSVFIALTLSPAIAANILRRKHATSRKPGSVGPRPGSRTRVELGRVKFNDGFDRFRDWFVSTVNRVVDRKWLFLGIYAGVFALLIALVLPASHRLPADRGPGRGAHPVPPARRRNHDAHAPGPAHGRKLFPRGAGKEERQDLLHRRRRRTRRGGQNTGQAFINLADYDKRSRHEEQRRRDRPARLRRIPRLARCAGLRTRARRHPRPRPIERLHDGAARTPAA